MRCPTCKQSLVRENSIFLCTHSHGALVPGKFLVDIENSLVDDEVSNRSAPDTKHDLPCPRCTKKMHKLDYNHTGIIIDSCTNCHYRWLDRGEIGKIKNFKPRFQPDDLLFLGDLERKLDTASKHKNHPKNNPRIPLFNVMRIISAGDSRRTLGALGGMGLYGIIVGMITSKFLRIVIPLLLLFFTISYYLVFVSFS